jgi:hypothetical protein
MRFQLLTALALGTVIAGLPTPSAAQGRRGAPTGAEIAAKARAVRLDRANAGVGEFQGKRMSFTPALLPQFKSIDDLKAGQVVGLLENGAVGDETGLPPGRYNLFVAEVDGQWRAYAEAGGQIVGEAIRTTIQTDEGAGRPADQASRGKPQFIVQGWCWQQVLWPWPYIAVTICF